MMIKRKLVGYFWIFRHLYGEKTEYIEEIFNRYNQTEAEMKKVIHAFLKVFFKLILA